MYTEKSFEKSFLNIVQLFEIEVVPSIKNKVFYSLHILKGFYTSLPKIIGGGGGEGGGDPAPLHPFTFYSASCVIWLYLWGEKILMSKLDCRKLNFKYSKV